jgi:hypothetical protein
VAEPIRKTTESASDRGRKARLGGITYSTGFYEFYEHRHNPGAHGRLSAKQRATKESLIAEALEHLKIASPELFKEMEVANGMDGQYRPTGDFDDVESNGPIQCMGIVRQPSKQ